MSQEVYEMIKRMDREKIETHLVIQCAPMISGIKISNLLIVERSMAAQVRRVLNRSGILWFLLLENEEKVTYLLYCKEELEDYLKEKNVCQSMKRFGYENFDLSVVLSQFQKRYESYMSQRGGFPHEMGLLLGYPVEDVEGFIENQGRNYLYSGYWKVYGHVEEKVALFERYEEARKLLLQFLAKGFCVKDMIAESRKQLVLTAGCVV